MRNRKPLLFWLPALLLGLFLAAHICPAQAASDLPIYEDTLATAWDNLSWDGTYNFANLSPVHSGSHSIAVTYTAAWGGLYLYANPPISTSGYTAVSFWVHGSTGGQNVAVSLNFNGAAYILPPLAGAWTQVIIPLSELGSPSQISDLVWQDASGGAQPTFYLDEIVLVGDDTPPTPTPPPGAGPTLIVNAAAGQHPISPYIYCMNFADEDLAEELRLPLRRWGGNATSRYNWELDISNQGMDWYYENIQVNPTHTRLEQFIEQDRRTGSATLVTMPLMGWTPKNDSQACGFSIQKYGNQDGNDWQWRPDCGNGRSGGEPITGNDPLDTSYTTTQAYVGEWVEALVNTYGAADAGGVRFYALDNEPMLWNDTHRDVHPMPTSYDEILERSLNVAAAIKASDTAALTLGPVTWGWTAYFWSALDWAGGGDWWNHPPDREAHGGMEFTAWYLQQMQTEETEHGQRLLDYLDLHYYPQAPGVTLSPAGSASTQVLRLRSTRALWDPTYADESWIDDNVRLIPRMRAWVDNYYPGTMLAITEYNWGGLEHINGALAQADVLGIFGREGLDLAALWDPPTSSQPGAYAFRMYLNYDGLGHGFGETSVSASSADQEQVSIYAARRDRDGALTLVILNKTGEALTSEVDLSGFDPATSALVYRYSAANLSAITRQPNQVVSTGGFSATFPANSITLVIIQPATPIVPVTQTYLPLLFVMH